MKRVLIQVSKRRFVIAESDSVDDTTFKVISKKFRTKWEVNKVIKELDTLDEKDYSNYTKEQLLEPWEEL